MNVALIVAGLWAALAVPCSLVAEVSWVPVGARDFVTRFAFKTVPGEKEPSFLDIKSKDTGRQVSISIGPSRISLVEQAEGGARELGRWTARKARAGRHSFWVMFEEHRLGVSLDGRRVFEGPADIGAKPEVRWREGASCRLDGPPAIQPVSRIDFADDFMRGNGRNDLWTFTGGEWAVQASATPSQASNAFRLFARSDGPTTGIARTSWWFWHHYRAGASFMSKDPRATFGLVFYQAGPSDYGLLRWARGEILELVRVRDKRSKVLARTSVKRDLRNWDRLDVVLYGAQIDGYLNGARVIRGTSASLLGGKVGLFVKSSRGVWMDDVQVTSVRHAGGKILENPFGPGELAEVNLTGKRFLRDAFMRGWAHPRANWVSAGGNFFWSEARAFNQATFRWHSSGPPLPAGTAVLFGDGVDPRSGYFLIWQGRTVTLRRSGREMERRSDFQPPKKSLEFRADSGQVRLITDGRQIFEFTDSRPLLSGYVGGDLGRTAGWRMAGRDWRDQVIVESRNRKEYVFDGAPVAWRVQAGEWSARNRWACVPMWSFFGGRGKVKTVLWNRRKVKGDFDLEVALAPMEGTPQRIHFAFPITTNLVFCADGQSLDSGYNLVFGTKDIPSRLYRQGRLVAETAARVVPQLRFRTQELYLTVTKTWQRVRVRREGRRLKIGAAMFDAAGHDQGFEPLLEFEDSQPLSGTNWGVWSWGPNGMAIARASVTFQESAGLAPTAAEPAVAPGKKEHRKSIWVRNAISGGPFHGSLVTDSLELPHSGRLRFEYRIDKKVHLGLFLRRGHELLQFAFAGPEQYRAGAIPLGPLKALADGAWHRADVDLYQAVWKTDPDRVYKPIDEVFLASPLSNIEEIAGLGVNRLGTDFQVRKIHLRSSVFHPKNRPLGPPSIEIHGRVPLDDFENGLGDWRTFGGPDGALLWRDPSGAKSGEYGLRLFNLRVAGPAGALITAAPFDARFFPHLRFDYAFPPDLEINLIVVSRGQRFEIRLTGNDASWPVLGAVGGFRADGSWQTAEFDLERALRQRFPGGGPLAVDSLLLADSGRMGSIQGLLYRIDNFCLVPAVQVQAPPEFHLRLRERELDGYSYVFDRQAETLPAEKLDGKGDLLKVTVPAEATWLHIRALTCTGQWSPAAHLPLQVQPGPADRFGTKAPAAPAVPASLPPAPRNTHVPPDALCFEDFEWNGDEEGLGTAMGGAGIRREAWVYPCVTDGAASNGSLEVLNLSTGGFFSAFLHSEPYSLRRYPRIAFDYKFMLPGCNLILSGLLNHEMAVVDWTSRSRPGSYFRPFKVGELAPPKQDGRWHHVDFDLLEMVRNSGREEAPALPLVLEQFNTWSAMPQGGGYHNPLGARLRIDNFTIYAAAGPSPASEKTESATGKRTKSSMQNH